MNSFAGLKEPFSNKEKAKAFILPIPYEKTTSYGKGTKNGPEAIIKASFELELYDLESNTNPAEKGIHTLDECSTLEDIKIPDRFFIALGGEHSISAPIVKQLKEKHKDISVLHFDAHADLKEEFEGNKISHVTALKRIRDYSKQTVSVGVRSLDEEEKELIKKEDIPMYYAHDTVLDNSTIQEIISKLSDNVYITFDVDVFDPSVVSAVGTPEPGGLRWYEILRLLQTVFHQKSVVGCDVVELCPNDLSRSSDYTIAKLVYKMIGYKFM